MGLDVIIFIAAILLGIFVYWRESQKNTVYRFFNKLFNSKALQMQPDNPKGFVYKQAFLPRLLYVAGILLLIGLVIQFLSPFAIFTSYYGISAFASTVVGTLVGTYVAHFALKSGQVIETKSDALEELVQDTLEKGKDLIDDLKTGTSNAVEQQETSKPSASAESTSQPETKSARARLKDKGLL